LLVKNLACEKPYFFRLWSCAGLPVDTRWAGAHGYPGHIHDRRRVPGRCHEPPTRSFRPPRCPTRSLRRATRLVLLRRVASQQGQACRLQHSSAWPQDGSHVTTFVRNSTAIQESSNRIFDLFTVIFSRKGFLHW
jgi:hypothetical protein